MTSRLVKFDRPRKRTEAHKSASCEIHKLVSRFYINRRQRQREDSYKYETKDNSEWASLIKLNILYAQPRFFCDPYVRFIATNENL